MFSAGKHRILKLCLPVGSVMWQQNEYSWRQSIHNIFQNKLPHNRFENLSVSNLESIYNQFCFVKYKTFNNFCTKIRVRGEQSKYKYNEVYFKNSDSIIITKTQKDHY